MTNVIYSLATGVGGMVIIAVIWLSVQQFVRRNSPHVSSDCDLLEHMGHDCGSCHQSESCGLHHH